jgi:hypothetical protein
MKTSTMWANHVFTVVLHATARSKSCAVARHILPLLAKWDKYKMVGGKCTSCLV